MEGLSGPRRCSARLLRHSWLTRDSFEIELERPAGFRFEAGQSVRIIEGAIERDYSIASGSREPLLSFCVRLVENGQLSPLLAAAAPDRSFELSGPHGFFTYREAPRPAIFVATGVGIAPFLSMARSGIKGFTLLHGVRSTEDLLFEQVFRRSAVRFVACLSRGPAGDAFPGRVTDWLKERMAPGRYDFYLCGSRAMVRDVTMLVDERFAGSRVYTEIFY